MKLPKIDIKVKVSKGDRIRLDSPEKTYRTLLDIFNADTINWTEEMILICMNRANEVIGYYKVASGGFSGVVCDPKVIMTIALQSAASGLILAHNHPSGNLNPSEADKNVTKKIQQACSILDMQLFDHVIVTEDGYYSFANEGLI